MICCIDCFKDNFLREQLELRKNIGNCEVCGKRNVFIYDTDKDNYLAQYLDGICDIYECDEGNLSNLLSYELDKKWGIFNLESEKIQELIINICKETYEINSDIFLKKVIIKELNDKEFMENNSMLKTYKWEDFTNSIKNTNRFHSRHLNLEILKKLFDRLKGEITKQQTFYRARISDINGFSTDEMGAPPSKLSTAGRANSAGISCLYLADNMNTTIHEIRARHLDFISIGEFKLEDDFEDIKIVDLTRMSMISPFEDESPMWFIANIDNIRKLENEIAKPLRRQDSELDYLPTQYISDFIKSIGYDGIKYKSTLNSDGNNYAIFSEDKFKCVNVEVYHIDNLTYNAKKIIKID
ncbi:RES family NAD+ phosphorylase [Clostridium sp.]|uniref:RES family NAD+ phosphorylase n=1 Tax=Clostridium sp. TaxID=1506 RepID=UPI002914B37D|nr:RES family NAD+ phosphorylase [Clostridium sp.]MDU4478586.1 RES family NAD+ phosphorylase [Clostridium sp.]